MRPLPGVVPVKLRPEVCRKISVAYRRAERDHPAVKVFVEEVLRTTGRLLSSQQ